MSKSGRLDCPGTSPLASLPSTLIQIIMTFIELNEAYWVFSLLSRSFATIPVACHTITLKYNKEILKESRQHRLQFRGLVRAVLFGSGVDLPATLFKNIQHMTICGAESFRWPVPASLSSVSVSVWRETTVDFVEDLLTGRELRALELKMGCVHIPKTALVGIFTKTTSTCPKFQLQHLQHLSLVDSTTGYITGKVISLIGKLERLQTLELENVYFPSDEKWDLSSLKNLHYVYVGTSPAGNDMVFCEFIASLFCIELQLTTTNFLPLELCETVQTFMWTITNPTVGRP